VAVASAGVAFAIGLAVLTGWYLALPSLLRLHPSFVAMQFTTALAFTFGAVAVYACMRQAHRIAIGAIGIMVVLALTAALAHAGIPAPSFDGILWYLGVDPALRPLTAIKTSAPGRMAPNTAVCFLMVSGALAGLVALPRSARATDVSGVAAIATVGVSLLALVGYLGGAPSTYGWGGLTRMAVHTAFAMLSLGIAVGALAARRVYALGGIMLDRLPAFLAVGGAVVSLGLWLAAADQEHNEQAKVVQTTALQVRNGIKGHIRQRLLAMERMRQRWELGDAWSRSRSFKNDVRLSLAHFPANRGIAWFDSAGAPVEIAVDDDEDLAALEQLFGELRVRMEVDRRLTTVRDDRSIALLEHVDKGSGSGTLIAIAPVRYRGRDDGFLVTVISVERIVDLALRDASVEGYAVRVRGATGVLYETPAATPARGIRPAHAPIEERDLRWDVAVAPSGAVVTAMDSRLPTIVACVGLVLTMLLTWSLRMVQIGRRRELAHLEAAERARDAEVAIERATELAHVNQQLIEQIAERERTQREHETTQQQLAQAQKMEAVGQLAGGVAHDFNNLLTVITSYCEFLKDDIAPDDPRRADVEEVLRASGSAARLTRQLLAFSRQQILQPEPMDLNVVVTELEKMLRRLIPADIVLHTSLDASLGAAVVDRGQIEQVIVNLVVNARDAMPDGGSLTIETSNVDLDEVYVSRWPQTAPHPGRYVVLSVGDTGHGMDEATQQRIFEPFFTTKERGRGTGLGLSTVYGIVKQSGGYVWMYSEVGRGTTFKIYLPRVEAATGTRMSPPEPREVRGGNETVLLVEDDTALRAIAQRVLERHGYSVIAAPNGEEAMRLNDQSNAAVDLVVTDIVMPHMGGPELVRQLRRRRADVRVLMMSGYTSDQSFRQRVIEEGIPFLEKPFTPGALLAKVRAVLDGELVEYSLLEAEDRIRSSGSHR
jgi:signal transduction histidine kinase/ActR/RegA family two-component response regulator